MAEPTTILDSFDKIEEDAGNGFRVVKFGLSGDSHRAAIVDAVIDSYPTPGTIADILAAFDGQKVTILRHGGTAFGAKVIVAEDGTLFHDGTALLPKGARRNGHKIDPTKVLDVVGGYNKIETMRAAVMNEVAKLPVVSKLTTDDLAALPVDAVDDEGHTSDCTLAVFGTHPGFGDGAAPGCVWLCCGYDPADDIVDGVLLVPTDSGLFSEHGSIFGEQLRRFGGKVEGFPGVTFGQALAWCDNYDTALAAVSGKEVLA